MAQPAPSSTAAPSAPDEMRPSSVPPPRVPPTAPLTQEELKSTLLRRLSYVMAAGLFANCAKNVLLGVPWIPEAALGVLLLIAGWLPAHQPHAGAWLERFVPLVLTGLAAVLSFTRWRGLLTPPSAVFLPYLGMVSLVLGGKRVYQLTLLISAAVLIGLALTAAPASPAQWRTFTNLVLCHGIVSAVILLPRRQYLQLTEDLGRHIEVLHQSATERNALLDGVVTRLDAALANLRGRGSVPRALSATEVRRIRDSVHGMLALVRSTRDLLRRNAVENAPSRVIVDQFRANAAVRQTLVKWLLRVTAWLMLLYLLRDGVLRLTAYPRLPSSILPMAAGALVACLGLSTWLRRRPQAVGGVAVGYMLVLISLEVGSTWLQGRDHVQPGILFAPAIPALAITLRGRGLGLTAGAAVLALLTYNWLGLSSSSTLDRQVLLNLALTTIVVTATWHYLTRVHSHVLLQMQFGYEKLRQEISSRRELAATIFHDFNNPLQAVISALELQELGEESEELGGQNVASLVDRMSSVLEVATKMATSEELLEEHFGEVSLRDLFQALDSVFSARLKDKQLSFSLGSGAELRVRAVVEVLRDSVLANLLSNAIKFTPRGGTLELSATLRGDRVVIALADEGGGIPKSVRSQLLGRQRIESTPGTEGEAGHGLGLRLAHHYLLRMGGRLELKSLPRGTQARLELPAAPSQLETTP